MLRVGAKNEASQSEGGFVNHWQLVIQDIWSVARGAFVACYLLLTLPLRFLFMICLLLAIAGGARSECFCYITKDIDWLIKKGNL